MSITCLERPLLQLSIRELEIPGDLEKQWIKSSDMLFIFAYFSAFLHRSHCADMMTSIINVDTPPRPCERMYEKQQITRDTACSTQRVIMPPTRRNMHTEA